MRESIHIIHLNLRTKDINKSGLFSVPRNYFGNVMQVLEKLVHLENIILLDQNPKLQKINKSLLGHVFFASRYLI